MSLSPVMDPPGTSVDVPRHDVVDMDGELKLYVELPGCKKQDVDVNISEQAGVKILKIRATRLVDRGLPGATRETESPRSREEDGEDPRKESPASRRTFEISFAVGDGIDASRARGALEDGVLTLVLPKVPPQPPAETIEIPIDPPASSSRTGAKRDGSSGTDDDGQGGASEAERNTHISLL